MATLSTVEAFKHIQPNEDMIVIEGELLQRLQDELLVMLGDVLDICDKYEIEYTLGGGTCLGAVRHQGFIPWDDDIDVNISRKDVDRFVDEFTREFGDRYWIHHPLYTHNYGMGFIRLRKKGTVFRTREDFDLDECGVALDLFIVENAPDNPALRLAHGMGSLALGLALSCRRFAAYGDEYLKLAGSNAELQKTFKAKIALGRIASIASIDSWCHAWYHWNAMCKNNHSQYLTIPVGRKHYFGELYLRTDYYPAKAAKFENLEAKIPQKPEVYFNVLYGPDFMTLPPVEEREAHVVYELDLG